MSTFEALYGRICNTFVSWDNPSDRPIIELDFLKEMEEQMVKMKHNLKLAQDRHKSYACIGKTHREFRVGEQVFLKVKDKKTSLKLGSFPKLIARYCGPLKYWRGLVLLHTFLHYMDPCAFIMSFMCLFLKSMCMILTM
jgi:hypothetical protein